MLFPLKWSLTLLIATHACTNDKKDDVKVKSEGQTASNASEVANKPSNPLSTSSDVNAGIESAPAGTKWNYPAEYCKHLDKIQLRIDVTEEKKVFCVDQVPTKVFLEQREEILKSEYGQFTVRELAPTVYQGEYSEFRLIWGFRVPIRPFLVKERPIYEYISQPFQTELVDLKPEWTKLARETLDASGLHLWSVNIDYTLNVNAAPGVLLYNYRQAQYNMYQVMAASEEMGFGLEHLVKADPEQYEIYNVLNVVINDGSGYNDGKGDSIIIGYIHAKINNQNYPAVSVVAITEIINKISANLAAGLMK